MTGTISPPSPGYGDLVTSGNPLSFVSSGQAYIP